MNLTVLKDRAKLLFKKLSKDIETDVSMSKCNGYIKDFEELKIEFLENGCEWLADDEFFEIEELQSGAFEGPSDEDIDDAMSDVYEQLDRILMKLGIDTDELEKSNKNNSPNINISPTFNQSQTQSQSTQVTINIEILVDQFEEELSRPNPDKSKLKSIMNEVLKYGKEYAPQILKIILKNIDKIHFGRLSGGFF